ncbi:MAG: hemolysin family protein [Maritimibacter harenae]|jgi:magnesium and cobalt transporter|uniref:CBS domain-containing protein n=1 Tax=Maritimibacter harenae TaxID=2606218 RepID=A0A845MA61_9RHOB|nr:hemolysin family protein [Maritimibacter harenae]MZR14833.1 CBS domain-containing protein [Maritimibacter harenae]
MGDTDGSSSAARGAREEEENARHEGFFGRIIGALSPAEADEEEADDTSAGAGDSARNLPLGMGNLRRMRVEDVMIPKVEVVAVPEDITLPDLVEVFRESGNTRLPVFRDTLDTPVGLVHLKDFALKHGFNGESPDFFLGDLVRPLIYAPPSMPIGVLLQKMQSDRMHMALVIDEYGGVDGLVTLEDLVEQVIGEIEDEHDLEEGALWAQESSGAWLVEARAPLDEFEEASGLRLITEDAEEEEIDTLGGLVFLEAGRVPARGEVIEHPSGAEFEVVDAEPRRIKRLRVRMTGQAGE